MTRLITLRAFSPCRMTTMPPTVSPRPSRSETPRRISGPISTRPTSRSSTGVPPAPTFTTICSKSATAPRVPRPANHVLAAGELHQPAAHLVVALANRRRRPGRAAGCRPTSLCGIDRHLVLADEAADRRHLRHARHGLERVAHRPVLIGPQLVGVVRAGAIDEGVLEDPADAGRVGAEFGLHAVRQPRLDLRQVLDDARPGPVEVGAVLEDHVDVGEPEVRVPAHGLHARRAEQRAGDRIGHLVLDDVGRPVPPRVDDDLGIRQVGQRVEADLAQHVDGRRRWPRPWPAARGTGCAPRTR